VGFSFIYIWLPRLVLGSGSYAENPTFYSALALITNFLFAVALATVLLAIFIDRRRPTETSHQAPGSGPNANPVGV
jgi:hypothetical protein